MKKILFASVCLSFSSFINAACHNHLDMGTPNDSDQLLCRDGYAVGYNYQKKVANWVSYYITKDSVNAFYKRSNSFKTDKELPSQFQSTSTDYSRTGYDRGHLAPSGTVDFSKDSMQQSFLMSNMAPQLPGFNRGGWKGLEDKIRNWANTYNELYVISGPVWDGNEEYIGNGVYIPNAFFKVILDPYYNDSIAYLIPHQKVKSSEMSKYITTVNKVEELTGFDFFSELNDGVEEDVESQLWETW
ncbi:DNA/RNA non-specific endonuclease [Parashewanella spongiae]|uniref:Endonuclease n=1 Tax=Parashewanella spongiae TaxID=342950 RepID=A0A3A6UKR8_9GAMM|nr:DNA/RNA non-specific endonuclease [Parashewanella spongiae]MCL1077778.1 DNA/RNA non-specific endonuclease [Parashewanella spongiae]RJY18175.1 DNA/RNA non-specific endonuclease [Parashewanella spongiae]